MKFRDIAGLAHAKRAAEVAIAGGHYVLFIGTAGSQASSLANLVYEYAYELNQLRARGESVYPCPCGNYRSKTRECTCTIEQINQWQANVWPIEQPEITLEVPATLPDNTMRWAKNGFKDGEAEESIARRIKRAISQKDTVEIDEAIWPLLRAAVRKLRLQPKHVKDLFALANTVAKLGGSDTIEACHMAEAIQYRPPNWTKWR